MAKGNITVPSEINIYNFTMNENSNLNTSNTPFEFFSVDNETGEKTPFILTGVFLEFEIKKNGCLLYSVNTDNELGTEIFIGTQPGEDTKMYLLTTTMNHLNRGQYDYYIRTEDNVSLIKGILTIKN